MKMAYIVFDFERISLKSKVCFQQVFNHLGSVYSKAAGLPQDKSQCGDVKLVNGTARDSEYHPHSGSLLVSLKV